MTACAFSVFAAPAGAAELTPDGAASLMNRWTGVEPAMLTPPSVLVGLRVTVGEGGRAGIVRAQAMAADRTDGLAPIVFEEPKLGPPVTLPAEPGVHTLPAPRVRTGWHSKTRVGLVQESGGHAIVETRPCTPENGPFGDWCQIAWLDGWPGGSRGGARLTLAAVTEPDLDRDFRGDSTEDRTDLRIGAGPAKPGADDRWRTPVTVTNDGPLIADLASLDTMPADADRRRFPPLATATEDGWEAGCVNLPWPRPQRDACALDAPLAVGASRTLTYVSRGPVDIVAAAEGEDLDPSDNTVRTGSGRQAVPTRAALTFKGLATLRRGITVAARGSGRSKLTATFKVGGRTVRIARTVTLKPDAARTLTLRARGAKLRTLRRAAERGRLRVTVSVVDAAGATASVTRRIG